MHPIRFALLLVSLCSLGCAQQTKVIETKIEKTRWHDQEAYRLTNGEVEAVVVPAWRRVMHFGRVGGDNVLWTGAEKNFKVNSSDWANYGGEKAWLWPQSQWVDSNGKKKEWPPPDDVAGSPGYEFVSVKNGKLKLRSMPSPLDQVVFERTYSLGYRSLYIHTSVAAVRADPPPRDWAIWSIAQIPRPKRVVVQKISGVTVNTMAGKLKLDTQHPRAVTIDPAVGEGKVGFDAGGLCAEYDNYNLSVESTVYHYGSDVIRPGEQAQVYVAPKPPAGQRDDGYVELEFTSQRLDHQRPSLMHSVEIEIQSPTRRAKSCRRSRFGIALSAWIRPLGNRVEPRGQRAGYGMCYACGVVPATHDVAPSAQTSFFQIDTDFLSSSINHRQASNDSPRWGVETAISTLG